MSPRENGSPRKNGCSPMSPRENASPQENGHLPVSPWENGSTRENSHLPMSPRENGSPLVIHLCLHRKMVVHEKIVICLCLEGRMLFAGEWLSVEKCFVQEYEVFCGDTFHP